MPTTYEPAEVPGWPAYAFVVQDSGRVAVSGPLLPAAEHPTRASAVDAVAAAAAGLGRPVRAQATERDGAVWHLVISPDGAVGELSVGARQGKAAKKRTAAGRTRRPDPGRAQPAPEPATAAPVAGATTPEALSEAVSRLDAQAAAGRADEAETLAAQLDEHAANALGLSHPDALLVREARARITGLAGDAVGGVLLYRDVAERWHYRGAYEQAEAVADRAQALWLEIADLATAIAAGVSVVRMRNQIPGEGGGAFAAAVEHQARLEAARDAGAGAAGPHRAAAR
ncbi:hypothetical protein [Streptomyces qinglanensis]|uniref:Uncharacterized protein n=1 Tax=Streptomyces qinglanensis TaxID=943816 RepID=A0A1H9SAP0_9ACTN|nr:hypothetical protein [Streptomyces qinglanensis]SER82064.1 hypothetical protein SAMN05421870_104404 [Streptomyces qinglanensis]